MYKYIKFLVNMYEGCQEVSIRKVKSILNKFTQHFCIPNKYCHQSILNKTKTKLKSTSNTHIAHTSTQ